MRNGSVWRGYRRRKPDTLGCDDRTLLEPFAPCIVYIQERVRKRIETSFSQITNLFPKHIHAVTPQGFELKIICFILAFAIQSL